MLILYSVQKLRESVVILMKKLQLLKQIDKLSSLLHSDDLQELNFTAGTIREMQQKLDRLTEEYIECYC